MRGMICWRPFASLSMGEPNYTPEGLLANDKRFPSHVWAIPSI